MRITAEKKLETRRRILESARKLFNQKGFEQTTTRDLAEHAGIAIGTLFNYFPSKETLGMTLVAEALDAALADFERQRRGDEALEELLFAHVAAGLRRLSPYRHAVGAIVESGLSPFTAVNSNEGQHVRTGHLETVAVLIADDKRVTTPSFVTMHLYWTLYLGVLAFWSCDTSSNQEDTLVVLDQSMRLFVGALSSESKNGREVNDVVDVTQNR
jgi:AcrR family transcriptional regulator